MTPTFDSTIKITPFYVSMVFVAVCITWLIHEFAHWFTSESLGYNSFMTLNGVGLVDGSYTSRIDQILISASGPLVTLLQAIIVYFMLKTNSALNYSLYPFLFVPLYMRLLAGFMNIIKLNDEAMVGNLMGVGTYTFPILINIILYYLVYSISKKSNLSMKTQIATIGIVMIFSSILILADQSLKFRIL